MHHRRPMKILVALCLAALAFTGGTFRALALAGELERPSLALPETIDATWREAVMKVLNANPDDFRGGRFINSSTTLRYAGDTDALNRFLAGLAKPPGTRLQVTFSRTVEHSWTVQHNGWGDARRFEIAVSLDASRIDLSRLVLPEIVGAAGAP
jgi:hypothetical protein